MDLEWKEPINIEDGNHEGQIVKVIEANRKGYDYIDLIIRPEGKDFEMSYSIPSNLTPNSKLGLVMISFGEQFEKGKSVNPKAILEGKECKFMTIKEKAKDGKEYCNIVDGSIKPLQDLTPEKV